jgi:hypothetical protein
MQHPEMLLSVLSREKRIVSICVSDVMPTCGSYLFRRLVAALDV